MGVKEVWGGVLRVIPPAARLDSVPQVLERPAHLLAEQCSTLASLLTRAGEERVPRAMGEINACLKQARGRHMSAFALPFVWDIVTLMCVCLLTTCPLTHCATTCC